jgi:hypothetical protein
MDNNKPEITNDDLKDAHPAYYLVRKCLDCSLANPEEGVQVNEMQFPTIESARAMLEGFRQVALKQYAGSYYQDNIMYVTDDEGDTHRYIEAIVVSAPTVAWRPGDDEKQIDAQFNDIISGIDFDTPTE